MSRERELLYRWYRGARDQVDYDELYDKTEELLAQPETEQEPVAWLCPEYGFLITDNTKQNGTHSPEMFSTPLYTSPQEREPMTGKEISQGFKADKDATNAESYWAGVAFAEKHYGVKINETL